MGQTRVDLMHLLEDLRDAYPGSLEETIVSETVANSLDSGARRITLDTDAPAATLTIADDGAGMTRAQLSRYHDLAATTKRRGHGIGFAGVGIKLALLGCEEVITESRRDGSVSTTSWRLASRQKAPWQRIRALGLAPQPSGTAVRLRLANPLAPLLDAGWLVTTLLRQFAPLFDPAFDDILAGTYTRGVTFQVNGRLVPRAALAHVRILGDPSTLERATVAARLARKRKPSALGWLARADRPLPEEERGVAVATLGKVIKRGWDWLGVSPATPDRITGLIEAPGLAEALTLNKGDFIRTGSRGATYLAYRKVIQEAVSAQLAAWGDAADDAPVRRPRTRRIEKDLENVLVGLADEFPLISTLVERRRGGQRRIPFGAGEPTGEDWAPTPSSVTPGSGETRAVQPPVQADERPSAGDGAINGGEGGPRAEPAADGTPESERSEAPPTASADAARSVAALPGRPAGRRPGRYGLAIDFETRDGDAQLARLVESTVWINDAHPAFHRAQAARAEGYHIALCVAMALAPLAVEPTAAHRFITTFLERWGSAGTGSRKRRRSVS